ncbi:hypothetical protein ZWY2020_027012 [Hordeum vulgare]|nr:hypothetical protein ZWY2020_027012 [Hordeum vulgare]
MSPPLRRHLRFRLPLPDIDPCLAALYSFGCRVTMARPSHHELRFVTLITGELFSLSHPPANFYRLLISGDTILAFIWTVSHIVQYCNLGDADVRYKTLVLKRIGDLKNRTP